MGVPWGSLLTWRHVYMSAILFMSIQLCFTRQRVKQSPQKRPIHSFYPHFDNITVSLTIYDINQNNNCDHSASIFDAISDHKWTLFKIKILFSRAVVTTNHPVYAWKLQQMCRMYNSINTNKYQLIYNKVYHKLTLSMCWPAPWYFLAKKCAFSSVSGNHFHEFAIFITDFCRQYTKKWPPILFKILCHHMPYSLIYTQDYPECPNQ